MAPERLATSPGCDVELLAILTTANLRMGSIAFARIEDICCGHIFRMKTTTGRYMLNTDDSHNSEDDIGAGGIVSDSNGQLIMAFAKFLGGSSNLVEAKAALYGVKWCISNGFRNIILESDSLIIINMLEGKINIAWQLQDSIDTIK
ncbi:hypothetical protein RND71_024290 [Anisodus tanguticus]|uniref:RNase H type-1 domain-containing protein n=1 Tax=Anisodus tanguticus TaxID=243964 RepID=A0AAE1RMU6_9SOLA|nr:hypothetical protein RND71_024290 [Anisodus tanguticus]